MGASLIPLIGDMTDNELKYLEHKDKERLRAALRVKKPRRHLIGEELDYAYGGAFEDDDFIEYPTERG